MKKTKLSKEEKWILWGAPVLFAAGSLLHFLFDLTGGNTVAAIFAAVNESTWEHMKLTVLPTILWWTVYFLKNQEKDNISADRWFTACAVSLITSLTLIPLLYYTVSQGLDVQNATVNILIFLAAVTAGQLAALHVYRYSRGIYFAVPILLITLISVLFIVFTFWPPELPLFIDPLTGEGGITAVAF